jgi:hypothetical protein
MIRFQLAEHTSYGSMSLANISYSANPMAIIASFSGALLAADHELQRGLHDGDDLLLGHLLRREGLQAAGSKTGVIALHYPPNDSRDMRHAASRPGLA